MHVIYTVPYYLLDMMFNSQDSNLIFNDKETLQITSEVYNNGSSYEMGCGIFFYGSDS